MKITFSQAVVGFTLAAQARRLSPHTISDYKNTFRKFAEYLNADPPISGITTTDIQNFLASRTGVTKKTIQGYHTGLSALWTWALDEGLVQEHIVRAIPAPKAERREILPFSPAEIKAILAAISRSRPYSRPGKRTSTHAVPNVERNRAIILLLLDTGLRASELCALRYHQIDTRNRRITVLGKGARERTIPYSPRTGQALWKYTAIREKTKAAEITPSDFVFVSRRGNPMARDRLYHLLRGIGDRAGVSGCHPHRFRHTFAIMFLRNGGDPYTLQAMLGHATLDMVRTYLRLAQIDIDAAHRRASPVENLHL